MGHLNLAGGNNQTDRRGVEIADLRAVPSKINIMSLTLDSYFSIYKELISPAGMETLFHVFQSKIGNVKQSGGKLLLAGNGASASIASHLATDFSKQAGVRAMTFNEANLITALGNDCGYENWIARALDLYADEGDLLVLISSSGRSPNVVSAARRAKEMRVDVVSFTGFEKDNPLGKLADINFWVNSRAYNVVECIHMIWLTAICDLLIGKAEYSVAG